MSTEGIQCGIHYAAFHKSPLVNSQQKLEKSEKEERQTISIPLHEKLSSKEIKHIINNVKRNKNE